MVKNKHTVDNHAIRCICLIALVIIIAIGACACKDASKEQQMVQKPQSQSYIVIETTYGPVRFPETLAGNMRHEEITEGNIAVEVFYLLQETGEMEVFRIYYGDPNMGDLLGYLTVDSGEISVTYTTCEYTEDDFQTEENWNLYFSMMDGFSMVLNSISEDARFGETRAVEAVGEREVKLRYWKMKLPANVQYTESEENGNYRVDFYGEVSGERIDLYMIGLGEIEAETTLGMYTVSGVEKPVVVQTGDMEVFDIWPEEDRMVINEMMNSINTVIQTIVADKNYAEYDAA